MKSRFMIPMILFLMLILMAYGLVYAFQEKLLFFPEKLKSNFLFQFDQKFEEMNIRMSDGISLNALLFKTDHPKGLIFYLHGNAGSLRTWGGVAEVFTDLGYDLFILDYRGYGKSEGTIQDQKQMYQDVQRAYDLLKNRYPEQEIIVLGYSMGTGPASKLASVNQPRLLILQAPYYSLSDLVKHYFPIFPSFLHKYPFENFRHIQKCKMPVVIFHGEQDEVIYPGSSIKLKAHFKEQDSLIMLNGQQHNGMTFNPEYQLKIKEILNR
ncbi:alpha/beta hydrolase [Cyclobacterium plantarum]|uniref:Alpha/beta hydrolase n=1 Tax=Cyclobacterium plantarum TaxID=2716263 RepID=A0ABX0H763_9BACT|nr:alpha/beta fold hydrolase [Cyclobacterium plantarum]NHE56056.1 alpha/beta hydrolase [Cyclobacterium plantarum]